MNGPNAILVNGRPVLLKGPVQKPIDGERRSNDTIPPDALRLYLVERRRALLTELRQLDKLLGLTTE